MLGLNSSQTSGPSNYEQAKNVQKLNTVNLVPVTSVDIIPNDQIPTTSIELEPPSICLDMYSSETKNDTTSVLSAIQYQSFDDIRKWPEHIDDNMRLHLIQQG